MTCKTVFKCNMLQVVRTKEVVYNNLPNSTV